MNIPENVTALLECSQEFGNELNERMDEISAQTAKLQHQYSGYDIVVVIGVAMQMILNACNQMAEENIKMLDTDMNDDELFLFYVAAVLMNCSATAKENRKVTMGSA